jgi:hypothetical protein
MARSAVIAHFRFYRRREISTAHELTLFLELGLVHSWGNPASLPEQASSALQAERTPGPHYLSMMAKSPWLGQTATVAKAAPGTP